MTKITSLLVVLCYFLSCVAAQEKTIRLQSEFEKILNESVSYNRDLIQSFQAIKDKKTAEQEIPTLISLNQQAGQIRKKSKEFMETLQENNISTENSKNYESIMSRYRLMVLPQLYQIIEERDRLDKNNWYGLCSEVKHKIQKTIYIAHSYRNPELKHRDTIHVLGELAEKSEKEAHKIISTLALISDKKSADEQVHTVSHLFGDIYKTLIVINMYIFDDCEGSKGELKNLNNIFLTLNEEIDMEISRLRDADYYESTALKKYIRSIGYPIMSINIPAP